MSTTTATAATATDPVLDLAEYQKQLAAKKNESTGSTTSTSASSKKSGSGTLGKDDFMTLLVTQLRYQDPLSPQDNSQMAAQMAQFSSLESMQNVQKAVEALGTTFTSMSDKQAESATAITSSSATGMIGKSLRFKQTDIALPSSGSATTVKVHGTSGSVALVTDADGNTVRTIPLAGTNADGSDILDASGNGTISWDGNDDKGVRTAVGSYKISVVDQATLKNTGYAYDEATVSTISFDDDGALLKAGALSFRMKDLVEILGSASTTGTSSASDTGAATTAALAMVGKTARFRDASAEVTAETTKDTSKPTWTFSATEGSIGQILDSKGNVVQSFSITKGEDFNSTTKTGSFHWDGSKSSGTYADEGTYYLQIVDPTKTKTTGTAYLEGTIDRIAFDLQGNPRLVSGDGVWTMQDLFTLN